MNYRTIADLDVAICKMLPKIPRPIDLVLGVPRSGMLPASLLALYLNTDMSDVFSYLDGYVMSRGITRIYGDHNAKHMKSGKEMTGLVVDDSVCSGGTMNMVRQRICEKNMAHIRFIYAAVYVLDSNSVDIYGEICPEPRIFEWNIFHMNCLRDACVDIDGVLCVDPAPGTDDDGEKYRDFILTARPLYLPTFEIGALVTCRLEKYREETKLWLSQHGIKYKKLIMLGMNSKEHRIQWGRHADFKALVCNRLNAGIFIESEWDQACRIAQLTYVPVFCVQKNAFVNKDAHESSRYITRWRRRRALTRPMTKGLVDISIELASS